MALKRRNRVDASFSMSSMTDIVFLLLIFFIVLSTFVSVNGLNLDLPNGGKANPQPVKVRLQVTNNNEFYINNEKVNYGDIQSKISQLKTKDGDNLLLLGAEKQVDWQYVADLMEIANKEGYKLIVEKKKQ